MKKTFKFFLFHSVLPYGGLSLVKMLSSTYRLKIVDPQNEGDAIGRDGSIIYASWHQRFFPGITFFATRKPIAILISRSRDGEFISHIVNILGWQAVRGSSSKGGSEGLQQLKELARRGYRIGHIVDGPKGPFGVVKPGLLRIAQASGMAVVPNHHVIREKVVLQELGQVSDSQAVFPGDHQVRRADLHPAGS